MTVDPAWLAKRLRDVPDFPKPGIVFKDVTPLMADVEAFAATVEALAEAARSFATPVDAVVGIEARGFIFGAPVAHAIGAAFVPVRKPGKLPWKTVSETYELEYGTDTLEVHEDALVAGQTAFVLDDVLATGGTAAATCRLVERLGARVAGLGFVVELGFLGGRARLPDSDVTSLITL
jgi:adenine phosphoribosyltransferase